MVTTVQLTSKEQDTFHSDKTRPTVRVRGRSFGSGIQNVRRQLFINNTKNYFYINALCTNFHCNDKHRHKAENYPECRTLADLYVYKHFSSPTGASTDDVSTDAF
jgi:hypothetical protein